MLNSAGTSAGEWRRYLGAIALLVIIAVLQLIPPEGGGHCGRRRDATTLHRGEGVDVDRRAGADRVVMVYLPRYVWRACCCSGASYQSPRVELREDFYRQLSRQHPAFPFAPSHRGSYRPRHQ
ncbi:hypothetical protein MJ390_07225 [Klebsiella pneumoniae]|nr:hypothetical protein MJ390_07225 [Klebsiella pneumoniae]